MSCPLNIVQLANYMYFVNCLFYGCCMNDNYNNNNYIIIIMFLFVLSLSTKLFKEHFMSKSCHSYQSYYMYIIFSYILRFEHYRDRMFWRAVFYQEWLKSSRFIQPYLDFFLGNFYSCNFSTFFTAVISTFFTTVISKNSCCYFTPNLHITCVFLRAFDVHLTAVISVNYGHNFIIFTAVISTFYGRNFNVFTAVISTFFTAVI